MDFALLYLFVAAALVRFAGISQSLWLDEATTANVVRTLDVAGILQVYSPNDFHPPLYYLFMDLWTQIFGYSVLSLRMPSVLFSMIAGYFVYLAGKRLGGEKTGFWAALFFLVNPLVLYYSQEARMYMMVTCLLSIALYCAVVLIKAKRIRLLPSLVLNLALGLAFGTFYGAAFFAAGMYVTFMLLRRPRLVLATLPGFLIAIAIVYPLLSAQYVHSRVALANVTNWNLSLGIPNLKNLLLIPVKFSIGRISFLPKLLYWAIAAGATAIVGFFALKGSYKNKWLAMLLVAPLLIAFVFSFTTPLLQYFRFIYLIPVLSLLLALGAHIFPWERALLLTIFITFGAAYLILPVFHREDWEHSLSSVPPDRIVYIVPSSADPLKYYYPDHPRGDIFAWAKTPPRDKELYVIPYTTDIFGYNYAGILSSNGYSLSERQDYRGVYVERWVK